MFSSHKFYLLSLMLLWKSYCLALVDLSDSFELASAIGQTPSMSNIIRKECEPLIGKQLKYVCRGLYPPPVKVRYKDRHVAAFEVYFVFRSEDNQFFITFGNLQLLECSTIFIQSPKHIDCQDRTAMYPFGQMECVSFHITIADELLSACLARTGASNFTAMHYADISPLMFVNCSHGQEGGHWLQLLLPVSILFAVVLMHRNYYRCYFSDSG